MASDPFSTDDRMPAGAATDRVESAIHHRAESRVIWSSSEGQITNLSVFVLAVLFFWLVLPLFYAGWRYLRTASHRYELTNQRLLVRSGVIVKDIETLELYRVRDMSVSGTLLQSLFGRGRIALISADATSPRLVINAIRDPERVCQMLRDAVEQCRGDKGVRAFDL